MNRKSLAIGSLKLLVLLVLFATPLIAQPKKVRDQAKTLQDDADRAFVQKNYRDAATKYGQAIVLVPNNAYAHYRKGFAHFNLQERDEAINEFSVALSQGFRPVEIFRVRAFIYYEQKNYTAALDDIQKGLALAPKDILFLKGLGEVQLELKKYPEALEALRRAELEAPRDPDIQYNLARVYFATGDTKGQKSAAEKAISSGTKFLGEAHYLLADADQKLRDAPGAISAYVKAIELKPDIYLAYRNLAEVYRNEGQFNDAIAISKKALLAFSSDGNIYSDLSGYYSLAGRPEDAIQAANSAISLLPNQSAAYTNLCRAYNDVRKYDLAVNACNSALRISPEDGETFYYLGNGYVGLDKSVEATRMYTRAVSGLLETTAKHPESSDDWYLLGNAFFADKQYDKATDAYLKCLSLSPKFLKARVNLGITYTRRKNKPAALEQYNLLLPADASLAARLKAEIDKM